MRITSMMSRYLVKLALRVGIFLVVFLFYLVHRSWLTTFMTQPIRNGFTLIHLIWLVFMVMMLHLFPHERLSMARRKADSLFYDAVPDYSELGLLRFM